MQVIFVEKTFQQVEFGTDLQICYDCSVEETKDIWYIYNKTL